MSDDPDEYPDSLCEDYPFVDETLWMACFKQKRLTAGERLFVSEMGERLMKFGYRARVNPEEFEIITRIHEKLDRRSPKFGRPR